MSNFWQKLNKPILALAPMAGITDSAFRQVCASFGADVVYTEMVSVDGLFYDSKKTLDLLENNKKEGRVVVQLFGKRPELFGKAVEVVQKHGFSGIDINFGCPARKVVAHGGGVTLMRDLDKCHEIVRATCEASQLPVSVKLRSSINAGNGQVTALDFVKKIIDLPIRAIMIHGRSYEQGFSGTIDNINFEMIKGVKDLVGDKIVVLANGGIKRPENAKTMLEKTGADGVGIAQGVLGKPWLFEQVKDFLDKGEYNEPELKQIKKLAQKHAKLNYELKGSRGMYEIRKHLAWYFKGFPGAAKWRDKLVRVENLAAIKKILNEIK